MNGKLRSMTSVYFTREDGVLCLFRIGSKVADKMYIGAAGGHFEPEEVGDARACVLREMNEELGLTESDVGGLTLRYITLRLKNGEIRQNYYFFARLLTDRPLSSCEGRLEWIRWEDLPGLVMPVSAKQMILHYVQTGRFDDRLYASITASDAPEQSHFTAMREF